MATRTVRLDDEAEEALEEIRRTADLSISEALKRGLTTLRREIRAGEGDGAWRCYAELDLGPGGYASAPSDAGREAVRAVIAKRAER